MVLSPAAAWLDGSSRSATESRFLLEITDGVTSWKAVDASCDQLNEPEALLGVDSVESQLDPVTRKPKSGSVEIVVDDDWIRPILVNNQLRHQKAIVTIGGKDMLENEFLSYFAGPIEEINPESTANGKHVVLKIEDIFSVLEKALIVGYWINTHPLQVILSMLAIADIPAAFIDSDAFDPSQSVYAGIRHYVVSRGGGKTDFSTDPGVNNPTSAFKLIGELSQILHGNLAINEDGQITFLLFDAAASPVDSWDKDVIRPNSFEQIGSEGIIINQVNAKFNRNSNGKTRNVVTLNETASQSANAYPGSTERILSFDFESPWFDYWGNLQTAIDDSITSIEVGPLHFASGTRDAGTGGGIPSGATIHSSRPAYLLLYDRHRGHEIVKADGLTLTTRSQYMNVRNPATGAVDNIGPFITVGTYTSVSRGQFGTDNLEYPLLTRVYDITILVNLALDMLARWKDEAAIVKLRTGEDQGDKQLGDFIDLTWADFLAYGKDGLSGDTFEIIAKRYDEGASEYEWKLAEVKNESLTVAATPIADRQLLDTRAIESVRIEEFVKPVVTEGLVGSAVTGLSGKITEGKVSAYPNLGELTADVTATFLASKDTWVSFDVHDESLKFYPEANGAGEPTKSPEEAWVAKFITNGSAITSVDNTVKNTDVFVDDIIDSNALADGAVTNVKIGAGAVDTAELATGAVTNGKISLDAVTSNKIQSGAVTAGKIGTAAINSFLLFAAGVVDQDALGTGSVVEAKISAGAVTSGKLGALSVIAGKIATGGVSASSQFGAGVVDNAAIGAAAVEEGNIANGAIIGAHISGLEIEPEHLNTGAVTEDKIGTGAVTNTKIGTGAVDTDELAAGAVTNPKIGTGAVDTAEIATGAVTHVEVADDSLGISNLNPEHQQSMSIAPDPSFSLYTRG